MTRHRDIYQPQLIETYLPARFTTESLQDRYFDLYDSLVQWPFLISVSVSLVVISDVAFAERHHICKIVTVVSLLWSSVLLVSRLLVPFSSTHIQLFRVLLSVGFCIWYMYKDAFVGMLGSPSLLLLCCMSLSPCGSSFLFAYFQARLTRSTYMDGYRPAFVCISCTETDTKAFGYTELSLMAPREGYTSG
jgi:hypothetical protein